MSEYQYYEWQTVDRPLTEREQAEVNRLSSHISVTPRSASVTYNWGDFKHDPLDVLAEYFDAFLYMANWGSRQLAFRFPQATLDLAVVEPFLLDDAISFEQVGDYRLLNFDLGEEDPDDELWVDAEGILPSLSLMRNELMQGDLRPLYLAWLGVQAQRMSWIDPQEITEQLEPPVPAGLRQLSYSQTQLVNWLGLDDVLIDAAAEVSADLSAVTDDELRQAIRQLPPEEVEDFLLRLAHAESALPFKLQKRLQVFLDRPVAPSAPRRKFGQLWKAARL